MIKKGSSDPFLIGFSCNNKDHDEFRGIPIKSYKDIDEISK